MLHHRLWPRALLTPFTDGVRLTDADRRAYTLYARTQRYKGFERVQARFRRAAKEGAGPPAAGLSGIPEPPPARR